MQRALNGLRSMLMQWNHVGYCKHQEYQDAKQTGHVRLHQGEREPNIDRVTHERIIATPNDRLELWPRP